MTYLDVTDAVEAALSARWPERTVYRDMCREGFERPSFLVQLLEVAPEDVNIGLVRWRAKLLVVVQEPLDDYADAPAGALTATQAEVGRLFAAGYLVALGRTVLLSVSGAGFIDDAAYVELAAEWIAPRDVRAAPEPPVMDALRWRVDVGS